MCCKTTNGENYCCADGYCGAPGSCITRWELGVILALFEFVLFFLAIIYYYITKKHEDTLRE